MPLAPAIAAALTTPAAHPWVLTVDGNDVIGGSGSGVHTPLETLELELVAQGDTSGLRFTIVDPSLAVTFVREGARVRLWDGSQNVERFRGWIQAWAIRPLGVGRAIEVTCIGQDAILDWAKVPAFAWATTGVSVQGAILAAVGAAIMPPGFTLIAKASGTDQGDELAGVGLIDIGWNVAEAISVENVTLREALNAIDRASTGAGGAPKGAQTGRIFFTVDMYDLLRAWPSSSKPQDWLDLTVDDVYPLAGGSSVAAEPVYENDATGAVHAVYVNGGNAAGSGLVSDGTAISGPIPILSDDAITTSSARDNAGYAYLADKRATQRAPLRLEDYVPAGAWDGHLRPGGRVDVTDTQLGLAGLADPGALLIDGATITWSAGGTREQWAISAGGKRPSAMRALRRLTRGILS